MAVNTPFVQMNYGQILEVPGYSTTSFPEDATWSVWLNASQKGISASDYAANLHKIYTISSMQVFFTVCENILPVSGLNVRYGYDFMLGGRRPVWEDDDNKQGGTWSFRCSKADTECIWRTSLEALVRGQLDDCIDNEDKLVGFSVGIREFGDVIHIWNSNASKASSATLIDRIIALLPKITFNKVTYKAFSSCSVVFPKKPLEPEKSLKKTVHWEKGEGDNLKTSPPKHRKTTFCAKKPLRPSTDLPACPTFPSDLALLSVWERQQHEMKKPEKTKRLPFSSNRQNSAAK